MTDKHNPPAFPLPTTRHPCKPNEGMGLRDYFAAAAMQSVILAAADFDFDNEEHAHQLVSGRAYGVADAMLEARKETP